MKRLLPLIFALVSSAAVAHDHAEARIFVIRSQLAQAGPDPIVFAGDSIVESALLPEEICGHRVVNAGIGGSTAYSYALLIRRLDFSASALVIAIGTNDSEANSVHDFPDRYRFLSKALQSRSKSVLYAGIPPLEPGQASETLDKSSSDAIDHSIRDYAKRDYIDIRAALAQSNRITIDGVHLSPEAQSAWVRAVVARLRSIMRCNL